MKLLKFLFVFILSFLLGFIERLIFDQKEDFLFEVFFESLLFSFIFIVLLSLTINYLNEKVKISIDESEAILFEDKMTVKSAKGLIGGKLILTKGKVYFKNHSLSKGFSLIINRDDILKVSKKKNFYFFDYLEIKGRNETLFISCSKCNEFYQLLNS